MAAGNTTTVTVTGAAGPGDALTASVFANVTSFAFDPVKQEFSFVTADGRNVIVSIALAPTITITVSAAGDYTVTIA